MLTLILEESRVSIMADGSCILLLLRARTVRLVVYIHSTGNLFTFHHCTTFAANELHTYSNLMHRKHCNSDE